jgi:hypothetical protein
MIVAAIVIFVIVPLIVLTVLTGDLIRWVRWHIKPPK